MEGVSSGVDRRGERAVGRVWEISVPSAEVCYQSKTALRNEVYLKTKNNPKLGIASEIVELTFKGLGRGVVYKKISRKLE